MEPKITEDSKFLTLLLTLSTEEAFSCQCKPGYFEKNPGSDNFFPTCEKCADGKWPSIDKTKCLTCSGGVKIDQNKDCICSSGTSDVWVKENESSYSCETCPSKAFRGPITISDKKC